MTRIDINQWINRDPAHKAFRQAVHIILTAIARAPGLQSSMIMKGGVLLALGYDSARFTKDIDFSTSARLPDFDLARFRAEFEAGLVLAVDQLGYSLDCRVQRCIQKPPREDADFPTIQLTVGYADRSKAGAHRRLMAGQSSDVIEVDYSLNEPEGSPEVVTFDEGETIRAYSFVDLVAEKFRALLQQEVRNRVRRQDIYDLYFLLVEQGMGHDGYSKLRIMNSLIEKTAARNLPVGHTSMQNPEIIRRTKAEYQNLALEIEGALLPFDQVYQSVQAFYESLPWSKP